MVNKTRPIISIIVPVYNTGLYLEECLNSIHNQTFKDYEVICVDDGSSDNSYEILNKYKNIIKNYKVIHQENQGVASARNTALKHVNGDYIAFIDILIVTILTYQLFGKKVKVYIIKNPY